MTEGSKLRRKSVKHAVAYHDEGGWRWPTQRADRGWRAECVLKAVSKLCLKGHL